MKLLDDAIEVKLRKHIVFLESLYSPWPWNIKKRLSAIEEADIWRAVLDRFRELRSREKED